MKEKNIPAESGKAPSRKMKGADIFVKCLEREGVEVIFAYPGGASLELHQALTRTKKIRTILPRHEQGCGFMAQGYARATGRAGVCMATSGPGATNLITTIADAYMDSIPMVAVTGQVFQTLIGKTAFQETDVFGLTLPVVKHSFLALRAEDLPRIIKEAFHLASTGRPGPVVIDLPKDVQQAMVIPDFEQEMQLPGYRLPPPPPEDMIREIMELISESRKPLIYAGGGIISSGAEAELREFADLTGIPVATTLMGQGCFPETVPSCLRWFGMHGSVAGNWAAYESDLLLAFGARFDDRITGAVSKFAPGATIVHIDIDKSEHHKNKRAHYPVHADIKTSLRGMLDIARAENFRKPDLAAWISKIQQWKKEHPFTYDKSHPHILPQEAVDVLCQETGGNAIITTGVGQNQMWAAQFYHYDKTRTHLSSCGLGTMGFGLPAALGAKVGRPGTQVVDVDGDGSFTMNIQELATAVMEKIPVKVLLLDNQHLGMVVQWEDRFYEGVRGQTILSDPHNIGGPGNPEGLYPDFVKICEGFGVKARMVLKKDDLRAGIREMLDHDGPFVLRVIVPYTEHVLPFIPQGKSAREILTE